MIRDHRRTPGWVENRSDRRHHIDLQELWTYRDLVGFLALRDVRVRYKQAVFGVIWAVLQPLVGAVTLVIVFHRVAHLSTGGIPYLPFTLVGFAGWTYFSNTVGTMTTSFVANATMVTKVYYPRVATPLAATLTGGIDLAIGLLVAAVTIAVTGLAPGWPVVLLPAWILTLGVLAFAVGLPLAALNVRFRDVGPLVTFSIQLLLFVTPVAYATSQVPGRWQWLYHVNPVVAVLDGLRWSLLGAPGPGLYAVISLGVGAMLIVLGLRYFASVERRFADLI